MLTINCAQKQLVNHLTGSLFQVKLSKYGYSCLENSLKTPCGEHIVTDCIGRGMDPLTVFKARVPQGIWNSLDDKTNVITTRILRLKGTEKSVNCGYNAKGECVDTYLRYVYIHGVPKDLFDMPNYGSNGCIILDHESMMRLFDEVSRVEDSVGGLKVVIHWPPNLQY